MSLLWLVSLSFALAQTFSYDDSLYLMRSLVGTPAYSLTKRELEGVTFDFVRAHEGKMNEDQLLSWVEDGTIEKFVRAWKLDLAQLMTIDAGGNPHSKDLPNTRLFNYDTFVYLRMDETAVANEISKYGEEEEVPYVVLRKAEEMECEEPRNFRYTFPKVKGRK